MRVLNFHGNQDGSKFQVLWDTKALVIEIDTRDDAHFQLYAASDKEMTDFFRVRQKLHIC